MSDSLQPHGLYVAHQAPLSMEFSRKKTEVDFHFLLQGIFLTQGSNSRLLCVLHLQADSVPLFHLESPFVNQLYLNKINFTKINKVF